MGVAMLKQTFTTGLLFSLLLPFSVGAQGLAQEDTLTDEMGAEKIFVLHAAIKQRNTQKDALETQLDPLLLDWLGGNALSKDELNEMDRLKNEIQSMAAKIEELKRQLYLEFAPFRETELSTQFVGSYSTQNGDLYIAERAACESPYEGLSLHLYFSTDGDGFERIGITECGLHSAHPERFSVRGNVLSVAGAFRTMNGVRVRGAACFKEGKRSKCPSWPSTVKMRGVKK